MMLIVAVSLDFTVFFQLLEVCAVPFAVIEEHEKDKFKFEVLIYST